MVSGVIAEFNIFHNGHKYLIEEAKKQSDAVIAVMSGSLVQRGDVAVTDKWSRTKMALMNGVDLVLELPTCYALNAAPNFAAGGVNTLNALGIVDTLMFGSESGNTDELTNAAKILENEDKYTADKIKLCLSEGMSYPTALEKAYDGKISSDILSMPNNILAIEYIRAIMKYSGDMKPLAVKRHMAEHHDSNISENFTSASKIREMLAGCEDISALIPYSLKEIGCPYPYLISRLDRAFIARLRTMSAEELRNISEVSEGIENRIIKAAMDTDNFEALANEVKSKRYTMSRIRRILIASLIGFSKDIYSPIPEYIRVLGMNKTGAELLKRAKKNCSVPIITKAADFREKSKQFELDLRSTDIASLCSPNKSERKGGEDFTHSPVIIQ